MKILVHSWVFAPSVGGMQTFAQVLCSEFVAIGHDVVLLTSTPGPADGYPFRVLRHPNPLELSRWLRWCDVVFCNGPSLRGLLPAWTARRPSVISHQTWAPPATGLALLERARRNLMRRAAGNIANSAALGSTLGVPATVIGNPYDDRVFQENRSVVRDRELVFLGRLIRDKGADLLLDALALLRSENLHPSLTIIGEGPERGALETRVQTLSLAPQVRFAGTLKGAALVRELNEHRVLVVPSRWEEPFGIVALEGMACGCVVVGSSGGGLAEAIGPAGIIFPSGDARALAEALATLLRSPGALEDYRRAAPAHLAVHRPAAVAAAYLEVLDSAARRSPGNKDGRRATRA